MKNGTVKWFNAEKGFGFISVAGEKEDVFFHYSGLVGNGYKTAAEGQKVTFEVEKDPKTNKLRAVNIQFIN